MDEWLRAIKNSEWKKYFPDFDTVANYKDIKSRLMVSINLMK